jgi:nicotinate-nucleotide adenylyltransferase
VRFSRSLPPTWSEVTAILGGRFDPPHLGHREAVRGLFERPGIQRVVILPSASPPHKPTWATADDRAEMAHLNFQTYGFDKFPAAVNLDRRELDRARLRPDIPSYTADSLQELRQIYPKLAFVVGTDQLAQLSTWSRFPLLLSLSHWIILERKPKGSEVARQTLQEWVASGLAMPSSQPNTFQISNVGTFLTLVPTEAADVSSTGIRETISKTGAPPPGTLLPEVAGYLKDHKLYGI